MYVSKESEQNYKCKIGIKLRVQLSTAAALLC